MEIWNNRWKTKKWIRHYYAAKSRCLYSKSSYKRYKIGFDLTKEDIKFLWERDKAENMQKPSLDRINTFGNYSVLNCRFIELRDNKKRLRRKSYLSSNRFKGVVYQGDHKKFRVSFRRKFVGYFSDEKQASEAYNLEASKEL